MQRIPSCSGFLGNFKNFLVLAIFDHHAETKIPVTSRTSPSLAGNWSGRSTALSSVPILTISEVWKALRYVRKLVRLARYAFVKQPQEGKTSRLDLQEENPAVVAELVNYFYTFYYDDCGLDFPEHHSEDNNANGSEEASNEDSRERSDSQAFMPGKLALHARMYVAGDMYRIDQLKLLAKSKFSTALVNGWDKEDLSEIIRFIYDHTVSSDRGLRESLVPILLQHQEELRADDTFMNVVETHGEFARDLINAWTNPNHQPRTFFKCDYCDRLYPNTYVGNCAGKNCPSYGRRSFRTLYMGV